MARRLAILGALILSLPATASAQPAHTPSGLRPYLVAVSVASVEEASAWYQRILGARVLDRKDLAEHGLKIAMLDVAGFRFELVELKGSVSPGSCTDVSNPASLRGFGKLGFQVDELEQVVAALEKGGVPILHDFRRSANSEDRSVIIKDPDGNWLQFFQRPR